MTGAAGIALIAMAAAGCSPPKQETAIQDMPDMGHPARAGVLPLRFGGPKSPPPPRLPNSRGGWGGGAPTPGAPRRGPPAPPRGMGRPPPVPRTRPEGSHERGPVGGASRDHPDAPGSG